MDYIEKLKGIDLKELQGFIEKSLAGMPSSKKILVLFPDYTRVDFTEIIAPLTAERFKDSHIDFLNAGGTHRSMTDEEFEAKLGIKKQGNIRFLNHNFSDPESLTTIGVIDKKLVREKTDNRLGTDIDITANKLLFSDYDLILAFSGTVPHEAAGYSGGLKIFFPGVSGPSVIDLFHWAAVLVGIPHIIGTIANNARDIINEGGRAIFNKIKCPVYSLNMVSIEKDNSVVPVGLYINKGFPGFLSAYEKAAEASSAVHVKYIEEPLELAVQVIPENYDEIWLAGKGSYKLQRPGVLKKGAEVILYAPHIRHFHTNPDIERDLFSLGYHCRDNVCSVIEEGAGVSKNAAAHLINVCGPGIFDQKTKKEDLRFKVTLATSIPDSECKKIGLSYRDPASLNRKDFSGPGKLWIEEGGKYLYDLKRKEK